MNNQYTIRNNPIIQSFFSITSSQLAGRLIFIAFSLFLMHRLGKYDYGLFQYIYSYTIYFLVVSGWGLDTYVLKRISEDPGLKVTVVSQVLYLKLIIFFLGGLVNTALFVVDKSIIPAENLAVFAILYTALFFELIGLALQSAFISLKKPNYFFVMNLSKFFFYALLGFILVSMNLGLIGVAVGFFLACAIRAVIGIFLFLRRVGGSFVPPDLRSIKETFLRSMPYALFILIASVYVHIDAILIGLIIDKGATGVYDASYKVIEATLFISSAFANSLMPYFVSDKRKGDKLDIVFTLISFVSFMIVFAVQAISPHLHHLFSDEFVESNQIAYYLAVYIPFAFMNHSLVFYHLARNNNWAMIRILAVGCCFNVLSNLIFIPRFGIFAAIVNTFITEMIICFCLVTALKVSGKFMLYALWISVLIVAFIMTFRFQFFDGGDFALRAVIAGLFVLLIDSKNLLRFYRWFRIARAD